MMKLSDKRTLIVLAIVAAIVVYLVVKNKEKYMPIGADYRYNTVDTNPERRTLDFLTIARLKIWKIVNVTTPTKVFHSPNVSSKYTEGATKSKLNL